MTVEQLRRYLKYQPFQPFVARLPDGRSLAVMHPELLIFSKSGRTVDIFDDPFGFETVDVLLIVSLRHVRQFGRGISL